MLFVYFPMYNLVFETYYTREWYSAFTIDTFQAPIRRSFPVLIHGWVGDTTFHTPAVFIIVTFYPGSNFNSEANLHKMSNLFYITMTIGFIVHNVTDILVSN